MMLIKRKTTRYYYGILSCSEPFTQAREIMASSLLFWFILGTLLTITSSRTLCPRIFFKNVNEDTMPYKIIEGVYTKEKDDHNNFPVYRLENQDLYFYHIVSKGNNYLVFARYGLYNQYKIYFVSAVLYEDPHFWLHSGILDRNDVFGGIVKHWQYSLKYRYTFYNTLDSTQYNVSTNYSSPMIKAVCVDEDFRECNSDRVYFKKIIPVSMGDIVNTFANDYFYRIQGMFRNLRPVYKHILNNDYPPWYLQYVDGYWVVKQQHRTAMRVKDFALRPEYITNTWEVHDVHFKKWHDEPNIMVMCKGVTSMSNTCRKYPCYHRATCVYTSSNETLCLCPPNYTGVVCQDYNMCFIPNYQEGTHFEYLENRPGDLGMVFCNDRSSIRVFVCEDNKPSSWSGLRSVCSDPTGEPITAAPRATQEPINVHDIVLVAVVTSVAVLVQIFLPFVLWCCALCKTTCKKVKEEEGDERRMDQICEELRRHLQRVAATGSQEELGRGVQEYRQRESDANQKSHKRGFYRNASLWRFISINMYFSFYLWLIYFVGCEVSHCTMYSSVLKIFRIIAIVMLCVSPVIVFIESFFCHELEYFKNIIEDETAWGYLQRMQEAPPKINMAVECYHHEARSRVVNYWDSHNGIQQSRTETYNEKVVTFVDQDEFSFGSWVDVSKREMPVLRTVALTRVKIDSSILFGDQETADDYERQVTEMLERNGHRDVFTAFSASKEIPGLKKRISAYVDLRVKPFWIRPLFFWIATLLQMTWPYRWLFRAKTAKSYYALKKKMYKSTTPPMEVDVMDPIAGLASSASSVVNPSGPDNTCPSYEMSVMSNPETGNPAFQNGEA
ncbi:hypothetical protein ACROYT_G027891 [Oculina patagonica]